MSDTPFPDVAGEAKGPLGHDAWNDRWERGDTPWDMGHAAPPFEGALDRGLVSAAGRALVVGCGAGHDARLFAERGFDVTAIDVSAAAVKRARGLAAEAGVTLDVRIADLFALPSDIRDLDLVVEHTCFCAIDPGRRDDYVDAVARALRPGGALLGLFFVFEAAEGPPFGASEDELRVRFGRHFDLVSMERPADSHPARADKDRLVLLRRRG